jgi:hypothetical protein
MKNYYEYVYCRNMVQKLYYLQHLLYIIEESWYLCHMATLVM